MDSLRGYARWSWRSLGLIAEGARAEQLPPAEYRSKFVSGVARHEEFEHWQASRVSMPLPNTEGTSAIVTSLQRHEWDTHTIWGGLRTTGTHIKLVATYRYEAR